MTLILVWVTAWAFLTDGAGGSFGLMFGSPSSSAYPARGKNRVVWLWWWCGIGPEVRPCSHGIHGRQTAVRTIRARVAMRDAAGRHVQRGDDNNKAAVDGPRSTRSVTVPARACVRRTVPVVVPHEPRQIPEIVIFKCHGERGRVPEPKVLQKGWGPRYQVRACVRARCRAGVRTTTNSAVALSCRRKGRPLRSTAQGTHVQTGMPGHASPSRGAGARHALPRERRPLNVTQKSQEATRAN